MTPKYGPTQARQLQSLWQWARNFKLTGAGVRVTNTEQTFCANIDPPQQTTIARIPPPILVRVTGTTYTPPGGSPVTLGIGKYSGNIWQPATSDDDATATLSLADMGINGTGTILIYNTSEVGETERHIDTTNASEAPIIYPATFLRAREDDNTPIYVIVDANWGSCSS